MEMNKKEIKEMIENIEYIITGLCTINGSYTKAVNIKILRKERKVYADILLVDQIDGRTERLNDCDYSFKMLGVK